MVKEAELTAETLEDGNSVFGTDDKAGWSRNRGNLNTGSTRREQRSSRHRLWTFAVLNRRRPERRAKPSVPPQNEYFLLDFAALRLFGISIWTRP